MVLNKIDLCSKALLKIGCSPISSFDEHTIESIVASQLYDIVKNTVLSDYNWQFGTKTVGLNELNSQPIEGYEKVFQTPKDCIKIVNVKSSIEGNGIDYKILSDEIYTNTETVFLEYIYEVEEKDFPPYFQNLMINTLSKEFVMPICEDTQKYSVLMSENNKIFSKCRSLDGLQKPLKSIKSFSLTSVRG